MDVDTSVLLILANSTNCVLKSCNASPVTPKRSLTSPTAEAAVLKSVGMVVAMLCAVSCNSLSASPVAPVFVVMESIASSTSLHAATDAAPTATIGAVTPVVKPSPTSLIFSPAVFSFLLVAVSVADILLSQDLAADSSFFSSSSVAIISRFHASYWSCVSVPSLSEAFRVSCAQLS